MIDHEQMENWDEAPGLTFLFDRYVGGVLMGEGVEITKQPDLQRAMIAAAKLAPRGPKGEIPVLVLNLDAHEAPIREAREEGRRKERARQGKFHEALIQIAHTFTEDSAGNMKSLPAGEYQAMARAAIQGNGA